MSSGMSARRVVIASSRESTKTADGGYATATSSAGLPIRCGCSSAAPLRRVSLASKALRLTLAAAILLIGGCNRGSASGRITRHLRVAGTTFTTPDRHPFQWRGITAFRLLEYVARGNEAEAKLLGNRMIAKALRALRVSPCSGTEIMPTSSRPEPVSLG